MDFFSVGQWTCKTLKNEEKKPDPKVRMPTQYYTHSLLVRQKLTAF